jgi:hypothetical protein
MTLRLKDITMRFDLRSLASVTLLVLLAPTLGCDEADGSDPSEGCAEGEKCDTPGGTQQEQCLARQSEVLDSSQRGFTPGAIRWACGDVAGVNTNTQDDRGQEYCEYYAVVQTPGATEAVDLGRPKSEGAGDVTANAICVEGENAENCRTTITADALAQLEDDPAAVIGACVFTSWHADVPGPLPACKKGKCGADAKLFGLPFDEEFFRMKVSFNSNNAAADLVQKCLDGKAPSPKKWSDASDPLTEPFFRGCMQVQGIFGTGWRRSDPSVCSVINRLDECGCSVPGVARKDLPTAIIPPQPRPDGSITLRGFRLGTWDDAEGLPPGCRYLETGDTSHTLVGCDLTASDVLANLNDPKELCRRTYGPNVVVHVPLPKDAIVCKPNKKTSAGKTCGTTPWNLGKENG